jgi:hypothetical protein
MPVLVDRYVLLGHAHAAVGGYCSSCMQRQGVNDQRVPKQSVGGRAPHVLIVIKLHCDQHSTTHSRTQRTAAVGMHQRAKLHDLTP